MHYGINIAVPIKTLIITDTVFYNFTMLPLWHIINVKEVALI